MCYPAAISENEILGRNQDCFSVNAYVPSLQCECVGGGGEKRGLVAGASYAQLIRRS